MTGFLKGLNPSPAKVAGGWDPAPATNPSSVTGLRVWLDAGRIPAVGSGTSVTTWTDLSGNGKNFTGTSTYQATAINGRAAIRFDGINQSLSNASVGADTDFTVLMVAQKQSAPNASTLKLFSANAGGAADLYTDTDVHATGYSWALTQAGANAANCLASAVSVGILIMRINSASSMDFFRNGGAATNIDPHDNVTTGAGRSLGASLIPDGYGDFDVAEYVEYSVALTATQLNTIGTYLATKYNVAWTTVT